MGTSRILSVVTVAALLVTSAGCSTSTEPTTTMLTFPVATSPTTEATTTSEASAVTTESSGIATTPATTITVASTERLPGQGALWYEGLFGDMIGLRLDTPWLEQPGVGVELTGTSHEGNCYPVGLIESTYYIASERVIDRFDVDRHYERIFLMRLTSQQTLSLERVTGLPIALTASMRLVARSDSLLSGCHIYGVELAGLLTVLAGVEGTWQVIVQDEAGQRYTRTVAWRVVEAARFIPNSTSRL